MEATVAEIRALLQRADEEELAAMERALEADSRKGVQSALAAARRRLAAEAVERGRVEALFAFDRAQLAAGSAGFVAGLDEVGRGSVAGSLAVGAVVLPDGCFIAGLNDSKQLSPEQRTAIAAEVKEKALAWAVCYIEPADIDDHGMAASLRKAFGGALAQVDASGLPIEAVLVDGNPLGIDPRERNVVKGDSRSAAIAAASVVAKVERDSLMCALSSTYPQYGFSDNKGYASPQHVEAIRRHGLCPVHRRSFCRSFMQESLF